MLRAIAILLLATGPALAEPARRCDAAALEQRGDEQTAMGQTSAAFSSYEAAARCKPGDRIHERAGVAACTMARKSRSEFWVAKAKLYMAKLPPAKRNKLAQVCVGGCGGPDGGPSRDP